MLIGYDVPTITELKDTCEDDDDALDAISEYIQAYRNVHDVSSDCTLMELSGESSDNIFVSLCQCDIVLGYLRLEIQARLDALKRLEKSKDLFVSLCMHYSVDEWE